MPEAASTTAILYEVFKAGDSRSSTDVATALYVGLVTDTGRFQYSNTTPAAHAWRRNSRKPGSTSTSVYREVYESTPLPKLLLLQRALSHLEVRLGGALVVSWLGARRLRAGRARTRATPRASSTVCAASRVCAWPR